MCAAQFEQKLRKVNKSIEHDKLQLYSKVKNDNIFQSQISIITFYPCASRKIKSWCATYDT